MPYDLFGRWASIFLLFRFPSFLWSSCLKHLAFAHAVLLVWPLAQLVLVLSALARSQSSRLFVILAFLGKWSLSLCVSTCEPWWLLVWTSVLLDGTQRVCFGHDLSRFSLNHASFMTLYFTSVVAMDMKYNEAWLIVEKLRWSWF